MADLPSAAPQAFELVLAERVFDVTVAGDADRQQKAQALMAEITEKNMAPFYSHCCEKFGWPVDEAKLREMAAKAEEQLQKVTERLADAEANLGETEVREALLAKAEHYVHVGDKASATTAYADVEKKTVAVGQKMDIQFGLMRLNIMFGQWGAVKDYIKKLKELLDSPSGGDWERRNKLKVYEGLYHMAIRNFKQAAELFLQSLSTFTTTDLFSYKKFIFYTVITSIIALDRVTLRQKVVYAPEILTVVGDIPHLTPFLTGLYECKYQDYMVAFQGLSDYVRTDMFLSRHYRYFMREARVVAYSQFLESYKSVTLDRMSAAFGVSSDFMDREVSLFIASGKLNCKIDKVARLLETNRPNVKNALYQQTIRKGDLLLNRLQRLGRIIDL